MNTKISFPDLVTLLATKLSVSKKDAEAFLKEFFTLAAEVITTGEELRIDGLGKFKPTWVATRASVNVSTGEPVEIPGHYKLTFLPDKVLRDAVNSPFSFFQVEVLNDGVSIEEMLPPEETPAVEEPEETGEEPVVLLPEPAVVTEQPEVEADAEVVSDSQDEQPGEPVKENTEESEENDDVEIGCCGDIVDDDLFYEAYDLENPRKKKVQADEAAKTEVEGEAVKEEPVVEAEEENRNMDENVGEEDTVEVEESRSGSRRRAWRVVWSSTAVLVVLLLAGGFYAYHTGMLTLDSLTSEAVESSTTKPIVVAKSETDDTPPVEPAVTPHPEEVIPETVIEPQTPATTDEVAPVPTPQPVPTVKSGTVETIRGGVTLAVLARKYFKATPFWVYIYEENKAIIKNPDNIPIGTEVVIPEASKYGIDPNSQASIDAAKALEKQLKGK